MIGVRPLVNDIMWLVVGNGMQDKNVLDCRLLSQAHSQESGTVT